MTEEEVRTIAAQLRRPDGELGVRVAEMMLESNISMIRCAMKSLYLNAQARVLEIGHGNGGHLSEFFNCAEGLRYEGLEISSLMHQSAYEFAVQNRLDESCNFSLYEGRNLPFTNQSMDAVFTVNTLYFWPDPLYMLQEMYRVMKPGARAAVCFGMKKYMQNLPFTAYNFRLYEPEDLIDIAEQADLPVIDRIEKNEIVRGKTGETVERNYACVVLIRPDGVQQT